MAKKRDTSAAEKPNPHEITFGAAKHFIDNLDLLAVFAREFPAGSTNIEDWRKLGFSYASAFIPWFDLTSLLITKVREDAARIYPPGSPPLRIGKANPSATVIEVVANPIGIQFRNSVYLERSHPFEPNIQALTEEAMARATARQVKNGKPPVPMGWGADYKALVAKETRAVIFQRLGIKSLADAQMFMIDEWIKIDPAKYEFVLSRLRFESIDFDELRVLLDREYRAVVTKFSARDETQTQSDPESKLLVRVAEAAGVAGMRKDLLLERLRARKYRIVGEEGAFSANIEQIIVALDGNKKRQVREWAIKIGILE